MLRIIDHMTLAIEEYRHLAIEQAAALRREDIGGDSGTQRLLRLLLDEQAEKLESHWAIHAEINKEADAESAGDAGDLITRALIGDITQLTLSAPRGAGVPLRLTARFHRDTGVMLTASGTDRGSVVLALRSMNQEVRRHLPTELIGRQLATALALLLTAGLIAVYLMLKLIRSFAEYFRGLLAGDSTLRSATNSSSISPFDPRVQDTLNGIVVLGLYLVGGLILISFLGVLGKTIFEIRHRIIPSFKIRA